MSEQTKIIEWDIEEGEVERKNLVDIAGNIIHIKSFHEETSEKYGKYIVIEAQEGEFYSFSQKLQRQTDDLAVLLTKAEIVRARVKVSNRQAYLTPP
ncbi:MAG: hypothetical protein QIT46_gp04 [Methanophagales virus PBV305]|uniref:Uncharacterized protein n=1 Tax=Methanophagales virus PBV305 TaxID=3071310 RepID=A0AA46TEC8_9VIRU|nr:MAG: hypothetical protein QIT46_gp04 [Methanophagales virus PBV305]UYL65056.1 MAG: hypothetical protein HJKPNNFO_00004 [Methanophagales virus PBV305]